MKRSTIRSGSPSCRASSSIPDQQPPPSAPSSSSTTPEARTRTILLIRRTLCAHAAHTKPLEELLPALTSSPDVDVQLYAIVAVVLRDLLMSWYADITSDRRLLDEVIQLIAHCTRALEQRLRGVDLETLVFDEIPVLLHAHVSDYRTAMQREGTALAPYMSLPEIFRCLQPHMALRTDEGETGERAYMKVVATGILSVLLPTEDLESDLERMLLTQILASTVFWNMLDRLSEPWFIYELMTVLLQALVPPPPSPSSAPAPPKYRSGSTKRTHKDKVALPYPDSKFWVVTEQVFNIVSVLLSIFLFLVTTVASYLLDRASADTSLPRHPKRTLLICTSLLPAVCTILNLPALQTTLQLVSLPFSSRSSRFAVLLDDLLLQIIKPLFTADTVVHILQLTRASLLPGDAFGPPRTPPSVSDARTAAETEILRVLPRFVGRIWFGRREADVRRGIDREWLQPWRLKEINKHIIVRIMDLLVVRLFPELEEHDGAEIFQERVGSALTDDRYAPFGLWEEDGGVAPEVRKVREWAWPLNRRDLDKDEAGTGGGSAGGGAADERGKRNGKGKGNSKWKGKSKA